MKDNTYIFLNRDVAESVMLACELVDVMPSSIGFEPVKGVIKANAPQVKTLLSMLEYLTETAEENDQDIPNDDLALLITFLKEQA